MPAKPFRDGLADLPRSTDETREANLIRATTDLYVQEALHDRDACRRYEELATNFLPRIDIEDRAYVAERLADRRDAPIAVIRMLARDVIDVAAPVLSVSPVLDTLTLLSTIAVTGAAHHRVIARRKDLPDQVKRALRLTGDPDVLRAIDGESAVTASSGRASAASPAAGDAHDEGHQDGWRFLDLARAERLAVLIDHATRAPAPPKGSAAHRVDRAFRSILAAAKIVGFARARQRDQLIAAIAEGLDLTPEFVTACLDDRSGEATAVLLKALRLDTVQAQQVLLLATPAGRDTALFFPLADLYAGMEAATAESIADGWRTQASGKPAGHQPYVADDERSRPAGAHETRTPASNVIGTIAKRA